ncbi:hypothetical protein AWENTII_006179 [Aspergillus wentii]|nr:myo-inositol transporter [Aspergillus wentii]
MHPSYSAELQIASLAVQRASVVTKTVLAEVDKGSTNKDDDSPVTIADFASQAILISAIRHNFPDDKFLGEESASALRGNPALAERVWKLITSTKLNHDESEMLVAAPTSIDEMLDFIDIGGDQNESASGRIWFLDPIDGTATFIRGQQYAVSVSLVVDGEQKVGVVGYPNLQFQSTYVEEALVDKDGYGLMLSAVKGYGAYKRQMTKASLQPPQKILKARKDLDIEDISFTESLESPWISVKKHSAVREKLGTRKQLANLWSMQVKYAALTIGAADAMIRIPRDKEYRPYAWDHAGGMLIFEESGGKITDLSGKPFNYGKGRKLSDNLGLVATSPEIHSQIRAVANQVFVDDSI